MSRRLIDVDKAYEDAYDRLHYRATLENEEYDAIINFLDAQPIVDDADHLIANGVTVQRWIPVTERLPEVGVWVLTLSKWGHIMDRKLYKYMTNDDVVFQPDGLLPQKDITHWMPLPMLPKDGDT